MKTHFSTKLTGAIAVGVLLTPALARAHPGHSDGLAAGIIHPFSGLDHIAAMVGVGLWAAQLGGRARSFVPLAFLAAMLAGAALPGAGLALPGVEHGVAASVLLIGLLLASARALPAAAAMIIAAAFALFHGSAHGSEMAVGLHPVDYITGFLLGTLVLQICGLALATAVTRLGQGVWVRFAGVAIASFGLLGSRLA